MNKLTHVWKNRIITTLGFLVMILPFLGFPQRWDDRLYVLFGLGIVALSFQLGRYLVYGEEVREEEKKETSPEKTVWSDDEVQVQMVRVEQVPETAIPSFISDVSAEETPRVEEREAVFVPSFADPVPVKPKVPRTRKPRTASSSSKIITARPVVSEWDETPTTV